MREDIRRAHARRLADFAGFGETVRKAFNGLLSVIVRAKPGTEGGIRIKVASEGLASAECEIAQGGK